MLQLSFVNFKQNSYILVENTPATDRFFIIQSGKVRSYNEVPIPGIPQEILGPGDFLGVISCFSGHSQTKTMIAMTPVVAIMVTRAQFPDLIVNNTPVALKIVKSFARDMRKVNDQLAKLTLFKASIDSPEAIYMIADYYHREGFTDIAAYGFYQYIKHCPTGINVVPARTALETLRKRSRAVYLEPTADAIRTYPINTMIFSECQTGSDMFIIQEGTVRISKVIDGSEITLAILKKGDMFGEMALLENKPRSACAIAHSDCKLMVINHANFNQMVSTQPQMISKLTTTFAERLWSVYRQLANTLLSEPREKLIDMIALHVEKAKNVIRGEAYNTGLSVIDAMKMCAIPSEKQNQAYLELQRDQTIKIVNNKIIVPDARQLIEQAAFYRKQSTKHGS